MANASESVRGRKTENTGKLTFPPSRAAKSLPQASHRLYRSEFSSCFHPIEFVPLGSFAFVPKGASVFAESRGGRGVNTCGEIQRLQLLFCAQSGKHPLGRERRFM